ncbi:ADAMTS-like protein 2 [Lytechinus variegatus]|uniref:ADAMTS-like protein 2 n=1 Tax=Lytechinus variegatus TaxID=7654 RepID=UPI001BB0F4DC|nr:ADAMTS-like protein 2 [Lytechinus variegatus]
MLLGLWAWCVLTVFNFRRRYVSCLYVGITIIVLFQPGQRHHHAYALSWGKLWGRSERGLADRDTVLHRHVREPVPAGNFHWSDYGLWTTCTASCGTGVEGRRRVCLDERSNEVAPENCAGYQKEYRLCRIQNCPNSFDLGYRAARCQEIAPPGERWKAYYPSERDGHSPCILACYNEHNQGEVRVVEHGVPSGTRCARFRNGVPETGVCIEGTCWSVGCDGYLNSTRYPDRCGVCGGDGSSCTVVFSEIISENLQVGYTDLIEVPVGATNIKISEIRSVRTYLALRNFNGDYLLNGNFRIETEFSKYLQAASSGIRYQRRNIFNGLHWEEREIITARGPLNETLHLQIFNLKDGSSNTLQYEYVIPIETSTQTPSSENSSQPHQSLTNSTTSIPRHFEAVESLLETENINPPLYPVNMSEINLDGPLLSKESSTAKVDVVNRTNVDLFDEDVGINVRVNDTTVGKNSRTQRPLILIQQPEEGLEEYAQSSVAQTNSTHNTSRVLDDVHTRNTTQDISFRAPIRHVEGPVVGPWGEGPEGMDPEWPRGWPEIASLEGAADRGQIVLETDGVQAGNTWPKNDGVRQDGEGQPYGPPYRTEDSPSNPAHPSQESITPEMVTVDLQTEEYRHAGDVVIDVIIDQPIVKQHEGDNKLGFESQVPEDLDMSESDYDDFLSSDIENGLGYSTRASSTRRYTTTTAPSTTNMKTEIQTTYEMATFLTSDAITSNPTTATTEPMTTIAITTQPPPKYFWRITSKMPCSATCGRGIIRDYAYCVDGDEEQVDDTKCDIDTKPDVIAKECRGKPCEPRWEAGSWSNCLGDCDSSFRFRTVHCWLMMGQGLDSSVPNERCNQTTKPSINMPCDENDCGPQWIVSEWSRCSETCGEGQETRRVSCSEGNRCDPAKRPESRRSCTTTPCVWATTSWSPCSGTCDVQSRRVFCVAEATNTRVQDRSCEGVEKPLSIQICGGRPCPAKWVPQTWGQCQGDCQSSFHRRAVVCQGISRSGQLIIYPDTSCSLNPPVKRLRCVMPNCQQQRRSAADWMTSAWKPCSVTCGKGMQTREVRCLIGGRLSDQCDASLRPNSSRECFKPACHSPIVSRNAANSRENNCHDSKSADCDLIVQANLCRFPRYSKQCCRSCRNVAGRSGSRSQK